MGTFIIIVLVSLVITLIPIILKKLINYKDEDGDFIPDVIEDKVEEVKEETKRRVERVKEELKDVKKSAKDLGGQLTDVVEAAAGSNRKGRKTNKVTKSSRREKKKSELIRLAKDDFEVELDSNLTKVKLVNKVYELYHKK
jgi:hypothetical protein